MSKFSVGDLVCMKPTWVKRYGKDDIRVEGGRLGGIISKGIDRWHIVRLLGPGSIARVFSEKEIVIVSSVNAGEDDQEYDDE